MSYSLYLHRYVKGKPAAIKRVDIEWQFTGAITSSDESGFTLEYDGLNACDVICTAISHSITIHRPCGDVLMADLIKIMQLGFICFGQDSVRIATIGNVISDDLPEGMTDAIGPLCDTKTVAELERALFH
ncbi:MAG: hypothetical protein ACK5OB_10240 [Pirellula sp.]